MSNQTKSLSLSLRRLDDDVLFQLFKKLRLAELRSLSATCKWIRSASMLVLFQSCAITVRREPVTTRFLPQSIWPYVRAIYLEDNCPDLDAMRRMLEPGEPLKLRLTTDPLLCGAFDGPFLRNAFQSMPRLRSVEFYYRYQEVHGMGWEVLENILSVPHLREFKLRMFCFSPRPLPPINGRALSLAPLTSFCYRQIGTRKHPDPGSEREALAVVMAELCHHLETLELPSRPAPLDTIARLHWPRLRKLELAGEYPEDLSYPLVSVLAGMPELRILALKFALPRGAQRQQLWPSNFTSSFPCPQLQELIIPCPHPDDQIYSHLPSSLRRLSLRCFPFHSLHLWYANRYAQCEWDSPLLRASEVLRILQRCKSLDLDSMQLEYRADSLDRELLREIAAAFPRLTSLEIHRFRNAENDTVPIEDIGSVLGTLSSLCVLYINLDFPELPEPSLRPRRGFMMMFSREDLEMYSRVLQEKALYFARTLGGSVHSIAFLRRLDDHANWLSFPVAARGDGPGSPRVVGDSRIVKHAIRTHAYGRR